jgi:H+/Cl- antiporter ClcA
MVKYRNLVLIIVFSIITLGIYAIYWLVSTTNELRRMTSSAPNPWFLLLLLVPVVDIFVAFWYYWKYSKAIREISDFEPVLLFVLWIIISPVAMIIAQIQLNKKAQASA